MVLLLETSLSALPVQTTQLGGLCVLLEFQKGVLHNYFAWCMAGWRTAFSSVVGLVDVQVELLLGFPGAAWTQAGASGWHESGKRRACLGTGLGRPAAGKAEPLCKWGTPLALQGPAKNQESRCI